MDERRLRKFFHFTESDLDANRRGDFSENQKQRLLAEARAEKKSARESATILFMIAAVGLVVGVTIASIAPISLGRALILFLLGILWPSAWVARGVRILRAARALKELRLREVRGTVRIRHLTDENYVLQVGDLEFDVDQHPASVLVDGDEYRFYYLETTEEILSAEYYPDRN